MPKYNHAYTVAFSLESDHPEGEDVTADMIRVALLRRIADLDEHGELVEAVGGPFDSYEKAPAVTGGV